MLFITIIGIIVWALWESHTTSREYLYKKNPHLAQRDKRQADETDRINANYREGMKKAGHPVADDYAYFYNSKKNR